MFWILLRYASDRDEGASHCGGLLWSKTGFRIQTEEVEFQLLMEAQLRSPSEVNDK